MSHHKDVKATLRITNDGKVLSVWWYNPYTNQLQHINTEAVDYWGEEE